MKRERKHESLGNAKWCEALSELGPFYKKSSTEMAGENFELFYWFLPRFFPLPETPRQTPGANTGSTIQSYFGCNRPRDSEETYGTVHMPTGHMSTDGCEALSAGETDTERNASYPMTHVPRDPTLMRKIGHLNHFS